MIQNKSAFITGAGRGLGLALTRRFLLEGWHVFPLVRKDDDALRLSKLGDKHCTPVISDVSQDDVRAGIRKALGPTHGIDVLINNAGIGGSGMTLAETGADEILSVLNVHCLGVFRVTQAVMPFMKSDGMIINISSRFGSTRKVSTGELDDIPCSYAYRIAKSAQNMLTQCMCREFKDSGVRICSVHPGKLRTASAASDADREPEEAARKLFGMLNDMEHGSFFGLFEGPIGY